MAGAWRREHPLSIHLTPPPRDGGRDQTPPGSTGAKSPERDASPSEERHSGEGRGASPAPARSRREGREEKRRHGDSAPLSLLPRLLEQLIAL